METAVTASADYGKNIVSRRDDAARELLESPEINSYAAFVGAMEEKGFPMNGRILNLDGHLLSKEGLNLPDLELSVGALPADIRSRLQQTLYGDTEEEIPAGRPQIEMGQAVRHAATIAAHTTKKEQISLIMKLEEEGTGEQIADLQERANNAMREIFMRELAIGMENRFPPPKGMSRIVGNKDALNAKISDGTKTQLKDAMFRMMRELILNHGFKLSDFA